MTSEDYINLLTLVKEVRMMLFGLLKRLDVRNTRPANPKKNILAQ